MLCLTPCFSIVPWCTPGTQAVTCPGLCLYPSLATTGLQSRRTVAWRARAGSRQLTKAPTEREPGKPGWCSASGDVLHPWTDPSSPGQACRGTCLSVHIPTNTHPGLTQGSARTGVRWGSQRPWGAGAGKGWRVQGREQGTALAVKPQAANQEADGVGGTFSLLRKGTSQHVPTGRTRAARGDEAPKAGGRPAGKPAPRCGAPSCRSLCLPPSGPSTMRKSL